MGAAAADRRSGPDPGNLPAPGVPEPVAADHGRVWDPSINPPISPSGEFIGDYQGLVADDCSAIPFVNDTHLANAPDRTPGFDLGLPRTPFQQVFAYTVPNVRQYGGTKKRHCGDTGNDGDHGGGGHARGGGDTATAARVRGPRISAAALRAARRHAAGVVAQTRVIRGR